MRDALSDFGPLMDLLEGRPATAAAPSGQRSENPSRRATRRAAEEPPRAESLFADDPRDSVAAAGDGGEVFLTQSKSTRVDDENERRNFTMQISERFRIIVYGKGEILTTAGDLADKLFLIRKGIITERSGVVMCDNR